MGSRALLVLTTVALGLFACSGHALATDQDVPAPGGATEFLSCRVDGPGARFLPVADPQPCVPSRVTKPLDWQTVPYRSVGERRIVPPCPPKCADRKCWEFRVGLAGWLPGMDGTITMAGQDSTVDFPWTDWFDNLDKIEFAIELFGSVRHKNWRFQAGWLTMVLGDSVPIPDAQGAKLDAEVTINIVRATIGYDVWRAPLSCFRGYPCFTTNLYAGARYYSMGVDLNTPGVPRVDRTWEWADPIVGTHLFLEFSPCWTAFLKGDVGGFGVGSDLSWAVGVGVEWRFWKHLALQAGWNVLDVDYETGSGTDRFQFDQNLSGPFLNIVAIF